MKTNFITINAPCQKEIIDQLAEVQQLALSCSSPFYSLDLSVCSGQRIDFELEWANNNPDAVFIIAQTGPLIIGFAQGFKVYADGAPGFLRGIGARELCGDEYFYLDTVVVSPWHQKKGVGKKLIEQIIETQTCQKALLWTKGDSAMSRLITKMDGKVAFPTQPNGCFMTLAVKR